jgi:uncharacterized protein YdeI (YjbR/CyaY-like superfamily)
VNIIFASTTDGWRAWLAQNCRSEKEIWLVIYHARSGTPGVRYHEAIEHALATGGSTAASANAPSSKRLILEWIAAAKRPGTRQRRINQTVDLAAVNIRANQPC